jgi:hypothetical protein
LRQRNRPTVAHNSGKILEATGIRAVPRSRNAAAEGTGRLLLDVNPQSEPVRLPLDMVQNQDVRIWKKGLRMARGEVPSLPQLKTI